MANHDRHAAKNYQWIEMFAGKGMAMSCVKAHGYRATHVDIKDAELYDVAERGSVFDILSASGFPTLNSTHA